MVGHDVITVGQRCDQSITTESVARVQEQVPACPVNLDLLYSVLRGWGSKNKEAWWVQRYQRSPLVQNMGLFGGLIGA